MDEASREAKSDESRYPRGGAQGRRERAENSIAIIGAALPVGFCFEEGQQRYRQDNQEHHHCPRVAVQLMQPAAQESAPWCAFVSRKLGGESSCQDPVLRC